MAAGIDAVWALTGLAAAEPPRPTAEPPRFALHNLQLSEGALRYRDGRDAARVIEHRVDGLRLDAIPYLIERDGTNCENLPETHDFLKEVRRTVDEEYPDRVLLAANGLVPAEAMFARAQSDAFAAPAVADDDDRSAREQNVGRADNAVQS